MDPTYIVTEIQTDTKNVTSVLSNVYTDISVAWQKFYTILSYAAVSELPLHGAVIINNHGYTEATQCFERPELFETQEPEENEQW